MKKPNSPSTISFRTLDFEVNKVRRRLKPSKSRTLETQPTPATAAARPLPTLHVHGEVVVRHGDHAFAAHNKIVGQGLRHLVNFLYHQFKPDAWNNVNGGNPLIRLGTGAGATGDGTTSLVAENATPPSSTTTDADNPTAGVYRWKTIAVWNAGVLGPITVTEMALKGNLLLALKSQVQTGQALFSRLSVADGEFVSFTVNPALPLTVEWRIVFTFA